MFAPRNPELKRWAIVADKSQMRTTKQKLRLTVTGKLEPMKIKIILLCALCLFSACANAQYGPGGKYHTPFQDMSEDLANQRAAIQAQHDEANRQAAYALAQSAALQSRISENPVKRSVAEDKRSN
jgi:hypothetical protein